MFCDVKQFLCFEPIQSAWNRMFDGKVKGIRQVNLSGKNAKTDSKSTKDLIEHARKQREARAVDRQRNIAVTKVQKLVRSTLVRKKWFASLRIHFDGKLDEITRELNPSSISAVISLLPVFCSRTVDNSRLVAVCNLLANILSLQDKSIPAILGADLSCVTNGCGQNMFRRIARVLEIAISELAHTQAQAADGTTLQVFLLALQRTNLSGSPIQENRSVGTALALYMAPSAARALRHLDAQGSTSTASAIHKSLRQELQRILMQALSFSASSCAESEHVRAALQYIRKTALQSVAQHLLTQPHRSSADAAAWAAHLSAEDWLGALQHCGGGTTMPPATPAGTGMDVQDAATSIAAPVVQTGSAAKLTTISASGLLNLLSNFADTFGASPQYQQRIFSATLTSSSTAEDAALALLGRKFTALCAELLCGADASPSASAASAAAAAERQASTAAASSMFGVPTKPPALPSAVGAAAQTSVAGAVEQPSPLPVLWMVENALNGGGRGASSYKHQTHTLDASLMDVEEEPAQQQVSEDVYTDYTLASGWKKLEFRIAGVRSGLVAQQGSIAAGDQGVAVLGRNAASRAEYLASVASLESLAVVLLRKETVTSLTNQVAADVVSSDQSLASEKSQSAAAVITLYTQLLMMFPPEVSSAQSSPRSSVFSSDNKATLLISLAFANPAVPLAKRLWLYIQEQYGALLDALVSYEDANLLHTRAFTEYAAAHDQHPASVYRHLLSALFLFCAVFLQQLAAIDDETLLEQAKIFTVLEIRAITGLLKRWLFKLFWTDPLFDIHSSLYATTPADCTADLLLKHHCQLAATRLFNHMCARNERRNFLSPEDWSWPQLSGFDVSLREDGGGGDMQGSTLLLKNSKVKAILTFIPQVVPFKQRVSVLHAQLDYDKAQYFSSQQHGAAAAIGLAGALHINVRRDALVADAYEQLHNVGAKLKGMVKVGFTSEQGYTEAGIDGGGLFKEFIDSFAKEAFSPSYGLFVPTSHQLLTPNPSSAMMGSNHLRYFNFVGKILGKSLYEHILLESEFAGGFLNFLLDRKNAVDDLFYLDEQLYRSLMQLKHFANSGGDVESLELYFESSRTEYGKVVTQELIPGGSEIKVSKANVHAYIHQLAHHKLNVDAAEQCRALRAGFQSLVPLEWIRMFSTRELQLLISGDRRSIDLGDMQAHVAYGGGYHPSQPYIQAFWAIVAEMGPEDQGNLLRFVTSCSRQPLLGFAQLQPNFCIQKVPAYASQYTGLEPPQPGERPKLPGAATCMNLLKLPMYDSVEMLRERLLYAIRSNSGFELS